MNLRDASDRSLEEIEDRFHIFAAGDPMATHGELFEQLCFAFQGRAIIHLLENFDLTRYRWQLKRSVEARAFYLRKMIAQKSSDSVYMALSRTEALFCALALNDHNSAQQIHRNSARSWQPDGEYKDDYFYHRVVYNLAQGNLDEASSQLIDFATAIDGRADPRLALCEAYIESREQEFWEAFVDYMTDRQEASALPPHVTSFVGEPWRLAFIYVSIPGIAWLQLAKARGFEQPHKEMPMCPSIALSSRSTPVAPNIFDELEVQFGL